MENNTAIYGVGTDLVEIARVKKAIEKNEHFLHRYYSKRERELIQQRGHRMAACAASNFAGKEAVAKAFGTGISGKVRMEQIEILGRKNGAPYVELTEDTLAYAREHYIGAIHISLTDTDSLAMAYAVAEHSAEHTDD